MPEDGVHLCYLESKPIESAANSLIQANNPKSVIRHAESVLIGKMRLSGILPVSVRILFLATPRRSPLRLRPGQKHAA